MMLDPATLIDGYLDETLSPAEHDALTQWLQAAPEHRQRFAEAVLLHDRLRAEVLALAATAPELAPVSSEFGGVRPRPRMRSVAAWFATLSAMALMATVLWRGWGETPASAAVVELNRLIAASARASDRTYRIAVEEVALPPERADRRRPPEPGRPPKPPLDGALLHVRSGHQFVLIRQTLEGLPFVTGSNGRVSWAVRPDGPVRFSSDLTRFHRDLPGHESNMPLINIEDGLEQLRAAYAIELLPIENDDETDRTQDGPLRLLVGLKKPGVRGPRRVEITYAVATGRIRQMRFVEMPYGAERLTLRMTLLEERDLGAEFFNHAAHHAPERTLEEE